VQRLEFQRPEGGLDLIAQRGIKICDASLEIVEPGSLINRYLSEMEMRLPHAPATPRSDARQPRLANFADECLKRLSKLLLYMHHPPEARIFLKDLATIQDALLHRAGRAVDARARLQARLRVCLRQMLYTIAQYAAIIAGETIHRLFRFLFIFTDKTDFLIL